MKKIKLPLIIVTITMIFLFNCNTAQEEEKEKISRPVIAQHTAGDESSMLFWGISNAANRLEWAQSFQTASNSTCSAVGIKLAERDGTPMGIYEIRIETNNTDRPSGTLVDPNSTKGILAVNLTDNAWNTWAFNAPFNLISGTTYWIVCRNDESVIVSNTCLLIIADSSSSYPSGQLGFYVNNGSFNSYSNDMIFKVYE